MPRKPKGALATTAKSCPFKVNLTPGPRPVQACVHDMEQASAIVRERTERIGNQEWSTGYALGDPRAFEAGPFPEHQRAGAVLDASGAVIANVSYNGKVFGPGPWKAGAVALFDPAANRPPPPPMYDMEWIRWFNKRGQEPARDAPPLGPADRESVARTFGLDTCRLVESLLRTTPTR